MSKKRESMAEINQLVPREELETMSRRDRKKHETRWRIYTSAIELFRSRDFDTVKIEEICEAADVSNAAFFHHFSSKASLISAYWDELNQYQGTAGLVTRRQCERKAGDHKHCRSSHIKGNICIHAAVIWCHCLG